MSHGDVHTVRATFGNLLASADRMAMRGNETARVRFLDRAADILRIADRSRASFPVAALLAMREDFRAAADGTKVAA